MGVGQLLGDRKEAMKKMKKVVLMMFIVMLVFPVLSFSDDSGVGEYVSAVNDDKAITVPFGHYGIMAKYADMFLSSIQNGNKAIFAELVFNNLDKYFILDIRRPVDYCAGHIPGAVNIQFEFVAKPENLAQLPADKTIILVCYSGHNASQLSGVLNMLGYDAWPMRYGMSSWRPYTPIKVWSSKDNQVINGAGYPMVKCQ